MVRTISVPPLISAPAAIVSRALSGGSSKPVWMSATISATNVIAGRMPPRRLGSSASTGGSGRPPASTPPAPIASSPTIHSGSTSVSPMT